MAKTVSLESIRKMIIKIRHEREDLKVAADTNLFDAGIMDSFSVMQLIQALESEYDIVLDFDDLRRNYFSSLEGICELLAIKYGIQKVN